jgi:hypothetical protein
MEPIPAYRAQKKPCAKRIATYSLTLAAAGAWSVALWGCGGGGSAGSGTPPGSVVVLGYNDLGMHCLGQDFSELCILPPANTVHAQVIRRGEEPNILTSGVIVRYTIPGNTRSDNKTNFWTYASALFGVSLSPNVGLFGAGLSGTMAPTADGDWIVQGVPITPLTDSMSLDPYQLATISVTSGSTVLASTEAVVPVSWEMNCNLCHSPGDSTQTNADILAKHDSEHGTSLSTSKPVLCSNCHADPILGKVGNPALPNLSRAMHGAHASRMGSIGLANKCYACHPGTTTQCLRDVHLTAGMSCTNCHGDMNAVASPARTPWVTLPRCGSCHTVSGHTYEQANTLYRNSKGHHGVKCEACHGSPHATTPTNTAADNVQAIALQGHAGTIDTCTVCHTSRPDDEFNHTFGTAGAGAPTAAKAASTKKTRRSL